MAAGPSAQERTPHAGKHLDVRHELILADDDRARRQHDADVVPVAVVGQEARESEGDVLMAGRRLGRHEELPAEYLVAIAVVRQARKVGPSPATGLDGHMHTVRSAGRGGPRFSATQRGASSCMTRKYSRSQAAGMLSRGE